MWSDKDIDNAFQRLNPPEPEPSPFPLDAWLRLETELDKAVMERAVRRRLWKFFAAEMLVVALAGLGWLLWPTGSPRFATTQRLQSAAAAHGSATNTGVSQQSAANQPAEVGKAALAIATLRRIQSVRTTLAPIAEEKAAEQFQQKSMPRLAPATAATASTAQPVSSAAAIASSVAVRKAHNRQRLHLAGSRLAHQPIAAAPEVLADSNRDAASQLELAAKKTATPRGAARQRGRHAMALVTTANTAGKHRAAGYLAAPTEAPAAAAVTAAPAGPLRRERQLPLLQESIISTSTQDEATTETATMGASAGTSATAVAALVPIDTQLAVAATAALPAPLPLVAVEPANVPVPVRQPRFYVGLVGAPDVSTVQFADVQHPFLNAGILLEYRLANRLRVSTGLLRSNKEYYARRQDYDWSKYPRALTRDFEWVEGTCTILDVPLNLRYDALVRPRARLFGAVGLSSFFMQRERYVYDYQEGGAYTEWDRSYVNENRHLFSILNLSVGYERSLGTHWSVQAEPYAKLPLGGVGVGKVRLTSGGVFFGVKYGF